MILESFAFRLVGVGVGKKSHNPTQKERGQPGTCAYLLSSHKHCRPGAYAYALRHLEWTTGAYAYALRHPGANAKSVPPAPGTNGLILYQNRYLPDSLYNIINTINEL